MPDTVSRVLERGSSLLVQSRIQDVFDLIEEESRADKDAQTLLAKLPSSGAWLSRRQVALHLTGKDDPAGYDRGDAVLLTLSRQGHEWGRYLLNTYARFVNTAAA